MKVANHFIFEKVLQFLDQYFKGYFSLNFSTGERSLKSKVDKESICISFSLEQDQFPEILNTPNHSSQIKQILSDTFSANISYLGVYWDLELDCNSEGKVNVSIDFKMLSK